MSRSNVLKCYQCKAPGLTVCGGCKVVVYCSGACQKESWSTHKSDCKRLKQHPPPPPGFYFASPPFESIQQVLFLPTGRPAYPSPWALQRALITTPSHSINARGDKLEFNLLRQPTPADAGRNLYEGLSKELAYMRIVDAYRVTCAGLSQGNMKLSEAEVLAYTPNATRFGTTYLLPLTYLPPHRKSILLPPCFPSSGPIDPLLIQEFVYICRSFGTSLDAPNSGEEMCLVGFFGGMDDLTVISEGVSDGKKIMEKERRVGRSG